MKKSQTLENQVVSKNNQSQKIDFEKVSEKIVNYFNELRQSMALFKPKNKKEYSSAIIAMLYYSAFFDIGRVLWSLKQIVNFGVDALKLCDVHSKEEFLFERASNYKKTRKIDSFSALQALKASELETIYNSLRESLSLPSNELVNQFIKPLIDLQVETENVPFTLQPAAIESSKAIECFILAKNNIEAKTNILPLAITRDNLIAYETGKSKSLHYFTALNVGESIK